MIHRVGRVEVVELPVQARIVKVDLLHRLQIIKMICLQMVELEMGLDLSLEEIVDTTAVFIQHLPLAQITITIIILISRKVSRHTLTL